MGFKQIIPDKEKNCSVCGKPIAPTGDGGGPHCAVVGFFFELSEATPGRTKYLQKQMGPYNPAGQYNICIECYLRAFGVPEPEAGPERKSE